VRRHGFEFRRLHTLLLGLHGPVDVERPKKRTSTTLAQPADNFAGLESAELGERWMSEFDRNPEQTIRERAYYIWEREGRPEGRAEDHWRYATNEVLRCGGDRRQLPMVDDEEKILAGRADANFPSLLTKDVKGG
jgi:Protein of unknown function (DUF2934)